VSIRPAQGWHSLGLTTRLGLNNVLNELLRCGESPERSRCPVTTESERAYSRSSKVSSRITIQILAGAEWDQQPQSRDGTWIFRDGRQDPEQQVRRKSARGDAGRSTWFVELMRRRKRAYYWKVFTRYNAR